MKIPSEILELLEIECDGLTFGEAALTIHLHDGHARYEVSRRRSIVPGTPSSGVGRPRPVKTCDDSAVGVRKAGEK